jgi:hypothetical protein
VTSEGGPILPAHRVWRSDVYRGSIFPLLSNARIVAIGLSA